MLTCRFELQLPKGVVQFNSQEELDTYIDNNYNRISAALNGADVSLSKQFNSKQEAVALLKQLKLETDTSITYDLNGNKIEKFTREGYTGVSRMLDDLRDVRDNKIFTPFNKSDYRKITLEKLVKNYTNNNPQGLSQDEILLKANEEIENVINGWEKVRSTGNEVHAVANIFFENEGINLDDLYSIYKKSNTILGKEAINEIYNALNKLKIVLGDMTQGVQDLEFFTEVAMYDEETKTVGIVDLVAVDKDGNSYLIDFKVSNKELQEWDQDKLKKSKFQLAYYNQLAKINNLKVKDLMIVPVYIKDFSPTIEEVNKLEFTDKIFERLKGTLTSNDSYITNIARNALGSKSDQTIETKNSGKVIETYNKIYGIKDTSFEEQFEDFMKRPFPQDKDGYYFYNAIDRQKTHIPTDKTQAKQVVQEYLLSLSLSKSESVNTLKEYLNELKANEKLEFESPFGKISSTERQTNIEKAFKHYVRSDWEIMNLPELESEGIIGFKNINGNHMEFVIVTAENLKGVKKLNFGKNILGNYLSDSDSNVVKSQKVEAEHRHLEASKILFHLNDNIESFKETQLNSVRAYNYSNGDLLGVNMQPLIDKMAVAFKKINEPFRLNQIKNADYAKILTSEIYNILDNKLTVSNKSLNLLKKINETVFNTENDHTQLYNQLIELQKRFINDIPAYAKPNEVSITDPLFSVWGYLNSLLLQLTDRKVTFESSDMVNYGMVDSKFLSTVNEITKRTARIAVEPIRVAMDAMSQEYTELNPKIRKIFDTFYKAKGVIALVGDHQLKFKNLFEKDAKGDIRPDFSFKNPEARPGDINYLDNADRQFLREMLPIINEFMYDNVDLDEKKMTGQYYQVPLARATGTSRMLDSPTGIFNAFINSYKDALDVQNVFDSQEEEVTNKANIMTEMFDQFNMSRLPNMRDSTLKEQDLIDFEKNIEILVSKLIYTKIRKKMFDRALPMTNAILASSRMQQEYFNDSNVDIMYSFVKDYVKTTVFGDKLTETHQDKLVRTAGVVKHSVSMLRLGLQPFNLIRETLQGQFGNFVKLAVKQYGEGTPSLANYSEALKIMMGESGDFLHSVTLIEELNHRYRLANMDTADLAEKMVISKKGITQFGSRWFLWAMGAPDYMNRMSFFVAKMLKDGSWEAHTMKDGELIYDWKKDKRFSLYANTSNPDILTQEQQDLYYNQKQLYLAMLAEFNSEARTVGSRDNDYVEGDALPRAYGNKERDSIKAFVNYVHGPYDKEEKILFNSTLFGMMFMQFKTWMISKKTQWYLKGDQYSIGGWKHMTNENGELLYVQEDGTIDILKTKQPYQAWQGRFMEGIWQSIMRTLNEVHNSWDNPSKIVEFMKNDPAVMANLKMAMADLTIFALIGLLFKGIIDWEALEEDSQLATQFLKSVTNSVDDLYVYNNLTAFLDPQSMFPTVGYATDLVSNTFAAMTGEKGWNRVIVESAAVTRAVDNLSDVFKNEE